MPLNINLQQILLHLLNFVVLFAILYFLLYKPVKKFMDNREEYYKKMDEQAKENLADSEKAKAEYETRLSEVDKEIAEKRKIAHAELEEAAALREKHAQEDAKKIIADAHKTIEADHARMLREAQVEITNMVTAAAEKIAAKQSTSDAFDQFLNASKRGDNK